MSNRRFRIAVLVPVVALAACSSLWQMGSQTGMRDGVSSSLVDYLYPKGEQPPDHSTTIPRLDLPLRVGVAFVPPRYDYSATIPEATKLDLLQKVRAAFIDRDYIQSIEVIPESYLRSSTGFDGMQQVARLYGVDVMALVSYDQVAISEDTRAGIFYWTVVGAYLVKGTENEIQTFVDTAVFDVPTRKLLFRAPGTDQQQNRSTAVESAAAVREGRMASFSAAMQNMTANLSTELENFEERLKKDPQLAEVSRRDSGGGGGSADFLTLLLLSVMIQLTRSGRRRGTRSR